MLNRRKVILGAGSIPLFSSIPQSATLAFSFGDALLGAGVALFPGAALALAGFGLVKTVQLVSNANNTVNNLNSLIDQTKSLEAHIDTVLNQVSATLTTIQSFVQDCDKTLQEIEVLIKQLPDALVAAFDAVATKGALAGLKADCANMSGYLNSKGSIVANQLRIQILCEKIVNDIIQVDALKDNMFQFVMQTIPGLTTWMQGYTAVNLLLPGDRRSVNPWDHQVVSSVALPMINTMIKSIKDQIAGDGQTAARIPLDSAVIYTFDGAKFSRTDKTFAVKYAAGEIDQGFYYTIWPAGVTWQMPPFAPPPPGAPQPPRGPQAGDFCYLLFGGSERFWVIPPASNLDFGPPPPLPPGVPPRPWPPADAAAAQRAGAVFPRLLTSALKSTVAFGQLTDGWQLFEKSKDANLTNGDKDLWVKMPMVSST